MHATNTSTVAYGDISSTSKFTGHIATPRCTQKTKNDSALSRTATPSEIPTTISAQADASNVSTTTEVKNLL